MTNNITPPATIGMLGSGQLGRMFIIEAKRLGYNVTVFAPDASNSPAGQLADSCITAAYDDFAALSQLASQVDVITYEFENVPAETAEFLNQKTSVFPAPNALATARNRLNEKSMAQNLGIKTTPFAAINSKQDLEQACKGLGLPCILKTCELGYDGKGQWKITQETDLETVFEELNGAPAILEKMAELKEEISVIAARNSNGDFATYGAIENVHANHILDISISPASVSKDVENTSITAIKKIMEHLNFVGVLCVEFFITTSNELLFNEMAPRPHNSGHLTIEGFKTCQFEQQVRAVCNLPLGSVERTQSASAMVNLLGDIWQPQTPNWAKMLQEQPTAKLHLYGKSSAKTGRKMGHITATATSTDAAKNIVQNARKCL